MSENHPTSGTPEYLEHGTGAPLLPDAGAVDPSAPTSAPNSAPSRKRRRAWWIAGGALLLVGAGAGAWAAMSFFQQGAQPAEALPASTIGYLSIDLDPSGGQKIDAFRTLNKFPAFKDQVGVNSVDDIRRKVGESMLEGTGCPGLTYAHDIDPWLGERAAVAAVELGGKTDTVGVVQVKDADKARSAITALNACDDSSQAAGFVVKDGWATIAESQEIADEVSQATAQGTLADDATYRKWTKAVGDAGVVNAYASPEAGRVLGQSLMGLLGSTSSPFGSSAASSSVTGTAAAGGSGSGSATVASEDPLSGALAGFRGGAATLRFTGSGLELAVAMDGSASKLTALAGSTGGQLVSRLPGDTAAAVGVTLEPGWLGKRLDAMTRGFGMSTDDLTRGLSRETGLRVPDDIETLLGSGFALSAGKSLDLEAAENSPDGSGIPVAATIKGDPTAIRGVLAKIEAKTGGVPFLDNDTSGDLVVLGPSSDYRTLVLSGGDLGSQDVFTGVVPDAAHASSVLYANVDDLEPMIEQADPGDQRTVANLTPLRAIGMSAWSDGGIARFSLEVTTD